MSKCWYCNEELTTTNYCDEHIGICTKCYGSMFKASNEFVKGLTDKIVDLEAKLTKNKKWLASNEGFLENEELKEQLSESEKEHELLIDQFEEETENLRKQIKQESDARKRFVEEVKNLKQQLAEKDKAIANWEYMYEGVVQSCHNGIEEDKRLEKLLVESEERYKKAYQEGLLQKQFDKDAEIMQLKEQLEEYKKDNEQLENRLHTAEQETLHFQNKYFDMQWQLAEKDKEIEIRQTTNDRLYKKNKKLENQIVESNIRFYKKGGIEQLENVKEFFLEEHRDEEMDTDYIITKDAGQIADYLLDQIKKLKEMK